MPSLIDIRRRVRAVKSTQQITKAMKMVAASRLRRAQERVQQARPFATEMRRVLGSLASRVDQSAHPLLDERALPKAGGKGRVVATEIMMMTPAIGNLVREGKTYQISSSMQAGRDLGMHTMDQHLADLVNKQKITYEVGLEKCHHVDDFNRLTGRT